LRAALVLAAIALLAAAPSGGPRDAPGAPKPGHAVANSVGMKMVYVPAGEFHMGSASGEKGHEYDETRHRVKISRPFRMSATEVTQAQWKAVSGRRRGRFRGDHLPVEQVSWKDAVAFCRTLSKTEGRTYRLPTEAEWEWACRAGSPGAFALRSGASGSKTGEKLDDLAWYDDNSRETTHPVAARKPNAWGLYDVHGNVAEWCADWYAAAYPAGPVTDPTGPAEGKARVVRGGSFASLARGCRSASRSSHPPAYQMPSVGFRVVMEIAK